MSSDGDWPTLSCCGVGSRPMMDRAGWTAVHAKSKPHAAHVRAWMVASQPGHSSSVELAATADGFTEVTASIADPSAAGTLS